MINLRTFQTFGMWEPMTASAANRSYVLKTNTRCVDFQDFAQSLLFVDKLHYLTSLKNA